MRGSLGVRGAVRVPGAALPSVPWQMPPRMAPSGTSLGEPDAHQTAFHTPGGAAGRVGVHAGVGCAAITDTSPLSWLRGLRKAPELCPPPLGAVGMADAPWGVTAPGDPPCPEKSSMKPLTAPQRVTKLGDSRGETWLGLWSRQKDTRCCWGVPKQHLGGRNHMDPPPRSRL